MAAIKCSNVPFGDMDTLAVERMTVFSCRKIHFGVVDWFGSWRARILYIYMSCIFNQHRNNNYGHRMCWPRAMQCGVGTIACLRLPNEILFDIQVSQLVVPNGSLYNITCGGSRMRYCSSPCLSLSLYIYNTKLVKSWVDRLNIYLLTAN